MLKRFTDITASLLGLIILSPLLLFLTLLNAMKYGRPVFFMQVRPGMHGRPFRIIMFRTMINARDGEGRLLADSHKQSKFGNFLCSLSLDELPELLNVLRGDICLVGPRQLLMEYLPRYNDFQKRRHEVRPGITGWAQVNGRNAISWEQRFELDVWYVDNHNCWLDIKILWLTLGKVVRREGIMAADGGFTEPFKGNEA